MNEVQRPSGRVVGGRWPVVGEAGFAGEGIRPLAGPAIHRPLTTDHRPPFALLRTAAVTLTLALLSSCGGCGRPDTVLDGGTGFVEEDAGATPRPDAGPGIIVTRPDSGQVDAGPPPELKITRALPGRGPEGGGVSVIIEGSGFVRGVADRATAAKALTTIRVGGNPAQDFQIIDDATIDVRVPPGVAGSRAISITNPNGSVSCGGCFTYYAELFLSSVSPNSGHLHGGETVTVKGGGFTDDLVVLFGGAEALDVTVLSPSELRVRVPRGAVADGVDVLVFNKNGVGRLIRAYRYFHELRLDRADPPAGSTSGGETVLLHGRGFSGLTQVRFGGTAATFTVQSDARVQVTTPPGAAGPVDLTLVGPRETWTVKAGFAYLADGAPAAVYALSPRFGQRTGGTPVTVLGQGFTSQSRVFFGSVEVAVTARTENTLQVVAPAQSGASPTVAVTVVEGNAPPRSPALDFTYRLEPTSLSPATGPADGGTAVTVSGFNFPADVEGKLGANGLGPLSGVGASSFGFVTPAGSTGRANDLWLRSAADPENEATLARAFLYDEPLRLGRVQPERGAIAGGTYVTVLGQGFGEGTIVKFGNAYAKDVKVQDSHTLICRTPRNDVGPVTVSALRLSAADELSAGFSYFDPKSSSGGLSGGPLQGTVNVTVLDSTPGFEGTPVPLATVLLGSDSTSPLQGQTDTRGQVTLSDPSIVKAQTATIFKEGYQSTTVTAISSENLTVYVARTGGGDPSPSPPQPGPRASTLAGKVTGFKPPRPLQPGEVLEARVFVAQTSLFGGIPFTNLPNRTGQTWQLSQDGDEYFLATGPGLRAVYAILGVRTATSFQPYLMGIRRSINVGLEEDLEGLDLVLDMHLDMTVPVDVQGAPLFNGQPAANNLYGWLDLGAEGFIPNPRNWNTGTALRSQVTSTQSTLSFDLFPRLDGSNFIVLDEVCSTSDCNQYPISYFFRRQPGDISRGMTLGPVLTGPTFVKPANGVFDGQIVWTPGGGPTPSFHQVNIYRLTAMGPVVIWQVVLPGTENQVSLPQAAVDKMREEEEGNTLLAAIFSSTEPRFAYGQWSYESLGGAGWTAYVVQTSGVFTP